jgi:hypothetical protein
LCYHVLTRCENEFDKVFNWKAWVRNVQHANARARLIVILKWSWYSVSLIYRVIMCKQVRSKKIKSRNFPQSRPRKLPTQSNKATLPRSPVRILSRRAPRRASQRRRSRNRLWLSRSTGEGIRSVKRRRLSSLARRVARLRNTSRRQKTQKVLNPNGYVSIECRCGRTRWFSSGSRVTASVYVPQRGLVWGHVERHIEGRLWRLEVARWC